MKRIAGLATVAILSGSLMTAAYGGEKDAVQMAQAGAGTRALPEQNSTSDYNKAKIERNKRARELKSSGTGTIKAAPAKSGSSVVERDKKRYETQKRAAEKRAAEMKKAEKSEKTKKAKKKDAKKKEPIDVQGQSKAK